MFVGLDQTIVGLVRGLARRSGVRRRCARLGLCRTFLRGRFESLLHCRCRGSPLCRLRPLCRQMLLAEYGRAALL